MHPLLKRSLLFVGAIIVVVALLTWGIGLDTIKARQVDLIYLGQQHLILVFNDLPRATAFNPGILIHVLCPADGYSQRHFVEPPVSTRYR